MRLHRWNIILKTISILYIVVGSLTFLMICAGLALLLNDGPAILRGMPAPLSTITQGWFLFMLYIIIGTLCMLGGVLGICRIVRGARIVSIILVVAEALNLVSVYLSAREPIWMLMALIGLVLGGTYLIGTRNAKYLAGSVV